MPSGNSGSSGNIPPPPQYGPSYQQGINVYLKNLDQMLAREQSSRNIYDPQRIQEQQALQSQFGPTQYSQMLSALGQMDPQWMGLRSQLGDNLSSNLANGTPLQGQADKLLGSLSNDYYNGTGLDKSANNQLTDSKGLLASLKGKYYGGSDSTNQAKSLLGDLQSQYKLGTQLSPDQEQQLEQETRRSQASRGNVYGQAPVEAEAFTKGQAGLNLQQQRLGNLEGGMGLYNQYGQQDLSNYLSGFQNNASNIGLANSLKQQEFGNLMGGFNQSNALNQQNYSNIGSFLSGPSVAQEASYVPPVSADRSMAYVNPNAGFQGAQFATQNYQNLLGQYGLQNQGSGSNPWMSAIGSIASIAGPVLGGLAFSDKRIKTGIKHIDTIHGIPIKEYAFKGDPGHRQVGVIAQDVAKTRPDAVSMHPSGMLQVNYRKLGLPLPAPVRGYDTGGIVRPTPGGIPSPMPMPGTAPPAPGPMPGTDNRSLPSPRSMPMTTGVPRGGTPGMPGPTGAQNPISLLAQAFGQNHLTSGAGYQNQFGPPPQAQVQSEPGGWGQPQGQTQNEPGQWGQPFGQTQSEPGQWGQWGWPIPGMGFSKGGKTTDTQPAMLTPGEVVLNKGEQAKVGLDRIMKAIGNRHGRPIGNGAMGFSDGGVSNWNGEGFPPEGSPSNYTSPSGQGPIGNEPASDPLIEPTPIPQGNLGQPSTVASGGTPIGTPAMNIPIPQPPGLTMPPNQQPMPFWMNFVPAVKAGYNAYRLGQRFNEMYGNYKATHPGGGADNGPSTGSGIPGEGNGGYYDPSYLMSIGYQPGQGTGSLWPGEGFAGAGGGPLAGSFAGLGSGGGGNLGTWQPERNLWQGKNPYTQQNFQNMIGFENSQGNALQGAKWFPGQTPGPVTPVNHDYQTYLAMWNAIKNKQGSPKLSIPFGNFGHSSHSGPSTSGQ